MLSKTDAVWVSISYGVRSGKQLVESLYQVMSEPDVDEGVKA